MATSSVSVCPISLTSAEGGLRPKERWPKVMQIGKAEPGFGSSSS